MFPSYDISGNAIGFTGRDKFFMQLLEFADYKKIKK